jgi:hypothetical protein
VWDCAPDYPMKRDDVRARITQPIITRPLSMMSRVPGSGTVEPEGSCRFNMPG